MYKISVKLFDKLVAQLKVDDLLMAKQLTSKKFDYQGGSWGDKRYSDTELRSIQGIYG